MSDHLKRGDFFGLVGAVGAAAALDAAPPAVAAPANETPEVAATSANVAATQTRHQLRSEPLAFTFLTPPEQAFVETAIDRLIPGAREADVAYYIDQQLAGAWGSGAQQYRQGPWMIGTPEQGYQLNMIPQQLYRVGIAQTNAYCHTRYGKTFDALSAQHRDEVLGGLEKGTIALPDVPAATFFAILLGNTVEGFFADPLYGGNRDKVGWKEIGFPGVAAAYVGVIGKYNVPYKVTPIGIADVEQGVADDPDKSPDPEHGQRVAMMHARSRREA